jgi:hypothetical protein
VRYPPGARVETMHGFGHYHETYERVGGRWLIKSTSVTRLAVDLS